jgi:hypothetical protein
MIIIIRIIIIESSSHENVEVNVLLISITVNATGSQLGSL